MYDIWCEKWTQNIYVNQQDFYQINTSLHGGHDFICFLNTIQEQHSSFILFLGHAILIKLHDDVSLFLGSLVIQEKLQIFP